MRPGSWRGARLRRDGLIYIVQLVREAAGDADMKGRRQGAFAPAQGGRLSTARETAGDAVAGAVGVCQHGEAFEKARAGEVRRLGLGGRVPVTPAPIAGNIAETQPVTARTRRREARDGRQGGAGRERAEVDLERKQVEQAADHCREDRDAMVGGAPDGGVGPPGGHAQHEAFQRAVMPGRQPPEFVEGGAAVEHPERIPPLRTRPDWIGAGIL